MTRPTRIRLAKGRTFAFAPHGGRSEQRRLTTSAALVGDSDWPGLRQVLRLARRVLDKRTGGLLHAETAYAVTSCPLWRGHWSVENQLHSIRDVVFAEDRASARAGHAPQVMAACRNAAIGLLRALGTTTIVETTRLFRAQPLAALRALGALPNLE
jgi:hypothetical protein